MLPLATDLGNTLGVLLIGIIIGMAFDVFGRGRK
jgi:hypothetical protein